MRFVGVVRNRDRFLIAIEAALDGWVNVVVMKSVTMTRVAGLPVSVTARRVHIVFSV
jgi:hypothetical protein